MVTWSRPSSAAEVCPGGERAAFAGEDDYTGFRVVSQLAASFLQFGLHAEVDGVQLFGPVQGDGDKAWQFVVSFDA